MAEHNIRAVDLKKKSSVSVRIAPVYYFADFINSASLPRETAWKYFESVPAGIMSLSGTMQEWPVMEELLKETEIEPSTELDEAKILEKTQLRLSMIEIFKISEQLERMEDKFEKHDSEMTLELQQLHKENDELKQILSHKYSAKSLLHFSVTASLALLLSLLVWFRFGIIIVHPALAAISLVGTLGFSALAIWRKT